MRYSILILVLFPWPLFSQIFLKGDVKGAKGEILPRASIWVMDGDRIVTFGSSKSAGTFSLEIQKDSIYELKVSFLGYETYFERFDSREKTHFQVEMIPSSKELTGVEIKSYPKSYVLKKDTILYDLEKVKDGTEKSIGDVLAKSPGLSVDENGKVLFQGNPISKIMIDGNDFFGNQQQMATKNIHPDVVSKAELLLNHKDSPLEIGPGRVALNLKTNERFKGRFTGDAVAYGGVDNKYLLHSNLFRFGKNGNFGLVADFNNIGQTPISLTDYIDLRGGIASFVPGSGSQAIRMDASKFPKFILSNDNLQAKRNNYLALTLNQKYGKKWELKSFSLLDNSFQKSFTESFRQIQDLHFSERNASSGNLDFGMLYLNARYLATKKSFINYNLVLNTGIDSYRQGIQFAEGGRTILNHTDLRNRNYTIGQNLEFQYKFSDKLFWISSIRNDYSKNIQNLDISSDTLLNFWNVTTLGQLYHNTINTSAINTNLTYSKGRTRWVGGMSYSQSNSKVDRTLFGDKEVASLQNNIFKGSLNVNIQVSEQFSVLLGNGFSLLRSQWQQRTNSLPYYEPQISFTYNQSRSNRFSLSGDKTYEFAQIQNLYYFDLVTDYRSVIQNKGVSNIIPTIHQRANFNFSNFMLSKEQMFNVSFSYTNSQNSIFRTFNLEDKVSFTKFMFSPVENTLTARVIFDRRLYVLPLYFKSRVAGSNTKGGILVRDIDTDFVRNNYSANLTLGTRFDKKILQLHTDFSYVTNTYTQTIDNPDSRINRYVFTYKVTGVIEKFVYEVRWIQNNQSTHINTNKLSMFSPEIRYMNKGWEFSLVGNNVFNLRDNKTLLATYSNIGTSETMTAILDGYLMFGVKKRF